jgi:hypothetical protein
MPYKDPAKKKAHAAAYHAANREKVRARDAAYYAANRVKVRARIAAYYAANRVKVRARAADKKRSENFLNYLKTIEAVEKLKTQNQGERTP